MDQSQVRNRVSSSFPSLPPCILISITRNVQDVYCGLSGTLGCVNLTLRRVGESRRELVERKEGTSSSPTPPPLPPFSLPFSLVVAIIGWTSYVVIGRICVPMLHRTSRAGFGGRGGEWESSSTPAQELFELTFPPPALPSLNSRLPRRLLHSPLLFLLELYQNRSHRSWVRQRCESLLQFFLLVLLSSRPRAHTLLSLALSMSLPSRSLPTLTTFNLTRPYPTQNHPPTPHFLQLPLFLPSKPTTSNDLPLLVQPTLFLSLPQLFLPQQHSQPQLRIVVEVSAHLLRCWLSVEPKKDR